MGALPPVGTTGESNTQGTPPEKSEKNELDYLEQQLQKFAWEYDNGKITLREFESDLESVEKKIISLPATSQQAKDDKGLALKCLRAAIHAIREYDDKRGGHYAAEQANFAADFLEKWGKTLS